MHDASSRTIILSAAQARIVNFDANPISAERCTGVRNPHSQEVLPPKKLKVLGGTAVVFDLGIEVTRTGAEDSRRGA